MKKFFLLLLIPFVSSLKLSRRSGDCKSSNKCTRCQGHCTDDTQCGEAGKTLKCYKRGDAMNQVPGCEVGEPAAAGSAIYNYCYEVCPSGAELSTEVGGVGCKGKIASVLKAAPGSCDGTQDGSLDIWVNTAVAANEIYDILSSNFKVAKIEAGDATMGTLRTTALVFTTAEGKINGVTNIIANSIGRISIAEDAVGSSEIAADAVKASEIAANAVGSSEIAANAVGSSEIAANAVKASEIAANAVGPSEIQNSGTFEMHAVSAYDGYIRAGTPSWNGGWKVNLDQNVWIHHKLEVDGVARFDSIANFRGTGGSYMVRKVIWGYSSGGVAVNHAGDIGYAYVYSYDNSYYQSSVAADFDGYIIAKYGVMTRSDRRIKQNIVDVSDISSLSRVLNIPVRNYQYKNQLKRGYGNVTGFIAQEIKEVFPEAVTLQTMGIPYIGATFKVFEMNNKIITIATPREANATLMVGDKLNAYIHLPDDDENSHTRYRELEVLTVGNSKTTLQCDECEENESANAIHIYEKIVDDFHVIDKDRIFTLHHGAIQELHREQENLKEKVLNLENTIASLTERLAVLEAK